MDPSPAQSEVPAEATYFDPEVEDVSEQQFSASLEAESARPNFVLDAPAQEIQSAACNDIPPSDVAEYGRSRPRLPDRPQLDSTALISRVDREPPSDEHFADSDWRDQVSAKVSSYKSRKPRKERYPSLQLQFDPGPFRTLERQSIPRISEPALEQYSAEPATLPTPVILETTARILEFPRPAEPPPPSRDELAEPIMAQPRIVEAPEFPPPPPALGGILIEAPKEPEPERRPGFDMPLQTAPISRRLTAALLDVGVLIGALAVFAYFLFRFNGPVGQPRILVETTCLLLAVLWPSYQYAFLVFTGSTPGLRLTRLAVTRFDGGPPSLSIRRWRVLASLLSCISLGLGYVWCFLDEDQLSWHDRITRTHLAPAQAGSPLG